MRKIRVSETGQKKGRENSAFDEDNEGNVMKGPWGRQPAPPSSHQAEPISVCISSTRWRRTMCLLPGIPSAFAMISVLKVGSSTMTAPCTPPFRRFSANSCKGRREKRLKGDIWDAVARPGLTCNSNQSGLTLNKQTIDDFPDVIQQIDGP